MDFFSFFRDVRLFFLGKFLHILAHLKNKKEKGKKEKKKIHNSSFLN